MTHGLTCSAIADYVSFVPLTTDASDSFLKLTRFKRRIKCLWSPALLHAQWILYYMDGWHNLDFFHSVLPHFYVTLEGKDPPCFPYCTRGQRLCVRYVVSLNDIQHLNTGEMRTVSAIREGKNCVKAML